VGNVLVNISRGRQAHYASLPAPNDALLLVPLEAAGLVSDATMVDYDTLADVLGGTSNEQTAVGRKTLTNVTVTIDDVNDWAAIDADSVTWTAPTGNAVGAVLLVYDPDTTAGTDASVVPISKHDLIWTPDGLDFTLSISDLIRA
jgi:hypothetical protein